MKRAHSPTGGSPARRRSPSPAGSSHSSLSTTDGLVGGSRSSRRRSDAVVDRAWSRYDGSSGLADNIDAETMPVVDPAAPAAHSLSLVVKQAYSPTGVSPARRRSPSPVGGSRSSLSPTSSSAGGSRSSRRRSGAVVNAAWSHYEGGSSELAGNVDTESVPVVDAAAPAACSPPPAVGTAAPTYDDSDSGSKESTDEEDDPRRGYTVPVPNGAALRVRYSQSQKAYQCPVCSGCKASRSPLEEQVRSHVVGQATSVSARELNKKKWSCHHVLARNHEWL